MCVYLCMCVLCSMIEGAYRGQNKIPNLELEFQ